MADDLAALLGDERDFGIVILVEAGHEIGLGRRRKGGEENGPDRGRIFAGLRPDDERHVVEMSGASSAFMPTTL